MAETNGYVSLKVGGKEYPLLFGRAAAQEMTNRTNKNLSDNSAKVLVDLIFSGQINYAIANDLPFPLYTESYTLSEALAEEEDAEEQVERMWATFNASRWGAEWVKALEAVKKKVENALADQLSGKDSELSV